MKKNTGFTLIEIMIVIAIIGILAGIAIPNFIAYRNKSFCSMAESDANNVAIMIAGYFSIPSRTSMPTEADFNLDMFVNPVSIAGGLEATITITVTDASGRCPAAYKASSKNGSGFWVGPASNDYVKQIVR